MFEEGFLNTHHTNLKKVLSRLGIHNPSLEDMTSIAEALEHDNILYRQYLFSLMPIKSTEEKHAEAEEKINKALDKRSIIMDKLLRFACDDGITFYVEHMPYLIDNYSEFLNQEEQDILEELVNDFSDVMTETLEVAFVRFLEGAEKLALEYIQEASKDLFYTGEDN
jgi:replicative superfamily II helicase